MMCKKPNSNDIMWYILGEYFIVVGVVSMQSLNLLSGTLLVMAGVALFPAIYRDFDSKYKKYIRVIVPGAFYKMAVVSAVIGALISGCANMDSKPVPEPETIVAEEDFEEEQDAEVKSLHLSESEVEMEINSSKEVILEVEPENFEVQDLELCSSNDDVAFLEKSEDQNENGKLKLQLKSESEGECEVFVKSSNEIESNRIIVKVTDSQKEEEDNSPAEEPSQEETVQQSEKEEAPVQESYQKPQETKPKTDNNTNKSQQSESSKPNTNNTHGAHIYCTPKGKRYHFDPDCGGKNSRETTLAEAQAKGLTPCKKCAK